MRGQLIRLEKTEKGTIGALKLNDELICWILERPWIDNQRNISCIPPGIYQCKRHESPKFGEVFKIMDVPERTDILFHPGNRICESLGCPMTGSEIGELKGERAVLESSKAFIKFMTALEGVDYFPLQII